MKKFANIAEVGDVIRAYDFKPMVGREDSFVEGTVVAKGFNNYCLYECYEIVTTKQVTMGKKQKTIGRTFYIPFEVSFMEYDGRIMNLSK